MLKIKDRELANFSLQLLKGEKPEGLDMKSGSEVIRAKINEACGGEFTRYTFMDNKGKVYQILADVLALPVNDAILDTWNNLIEVEQVGYGDQKAWTVEKPQHFHVAKVAAGTKDIRRQEILAGEELTIKTDYYAVKLFTELEKFQSGRVDFAKFVSQVSVDFDRFVSSLIYKTFVGSYDALNAKLKYRGILDITEIQKRIKKVEAKTGMKCALYATGATLTEVSRAIATTNAVIGLSERKKEEFGAVGYFGDFYGTDMIELQNMLDENDEFILEDNVIYILPIGQKIMKLVYEGDVLVDSNLDNPTSRNDLQLEFFFRKKLGVGILVADFYGIVEITE